MIRISEPYLPSVDKYKRYLDTIYSNRWLTNNGPLVQELESRLKAFLGVKYIVLVNNGTMALDLAYRLSGLTGNVLTTPFSFIATSSSLAWEGLTPVFSDIERKSLNLDPLLLKEKMTFSPGGIVPVHVFGNACDVDAIASFAQGNNLKVIYDASHAFGVKYENKSILEYGDISTLSFHCTKTFHTIEGGAVVVQKEEDYLALKEMINFGQNNHQIKRVGTNAKMNEFSAAMGLCVLEEYDKLHSHRKIIHEIYFTGLKDLVEFPMQNEFSTRNFTYFPIILKSEEEQNKVQTELLADGVESRRYFYPSLDQVPCLQGHSPENPVSQDITLRILTIPIGPHVSEAEALRVVEKIKRIL